MADQDYMLDFEAFQNSFKKTEVSGEEVGEMIMKMAGYFARYNTRMGEALRAISAVRSRYQNSVDESTGKAMTTSKAEISADNTPEADAYTMAKIHVQNIQEYINSLKALQRGVLFEYAQS